VRKVRANKSVAAAILRRGQPLLQHLLERHQKKQKTRIPARFLT
jgi:hypothetical protein